MTGITSKLEVTVRMWMLNPRIPCRNHLLGEHRETHTAEGSLKKKKSFTGYVRNGLIELGALKVRHDELAQEMTRRGYRHETPLDIIPDFSYLPANEREATVDPEKSLKDLLERCPQCRIRYAMCLQLGERI